MCPTLSHPHSPGNGAGPSTVGLVNPTIGLAIRSGSPQAFLLLSPHPE